MTSSCCLHHQCNNVALATIVFLLTTMIDMREQTMLDEQHPPSQYVTGLEAVADADAKTTATTISTATISTTENDAYSKQITTESKLSTLTSASPDGSSQLERILLNATTTDMLTSSSLQLQQDQQRSEENSSISRAQYESPAALWQPTQAVLAAAGPPVNAFSVPTAAIAPTSTTPATDQQHRSNYSIKFTTFRPLLVPTLPDIRHRIIHSMPYQSKHHHERHWGPFFEEPLNVTSGALQVGYHLSTEAILNCRVGMLKDKTVMWIRRTTDKVSLLTVGNNTYSGDPRIRVKFQYPNNWRLHINPIRSDDAGLYMCQVSTHPPRVFATNLTVLEPAVRIVDEMGYEFYDRYYKLGSTIDICCQVSLSYLATLPPTAKQQPGGAFNGLEQQQQMQNGAKSKLPAEAASTSNNHKDKTKQSLPQNVVWKKDGIELPKDIKLSSSLSKQWFHSRLSIIQAERTHSGIYTCTVADKQTTSAQIQVLNGETPAAVQHNGCYKERAISILVFYCVLSYWIQLHISYT
ncbi:uncharacterized protein LOC129751742 [Uranotaenia lowii]|uniref:uncharacterized protein LOC129751742 n=1 Tax=Uranotaenia lowii TaxID=190385 RepID=UPI00247B1083|nr:uncharacterized protein LOC129751742 [Uranotaenia lowii]XP_055603398.1 uncharacterized protein LOC129751742 [Uranotaenia lowii]